MYTCEVCNKKFTSKIGLNSHICRFKDSEHYQYWLSYLQELHGIPDVHVLAYKKDNGEKMIQIHNDICGHTVWINYYSLIRQHQSCNHKDCVSKTKREAIKKWLKKNNISYHKNSKVSKQESLRPLGSEECNNYISQRVKEALKDPVKRMNRLKGQANYQRHLNSQYELCFIGILTKYNINYTYQVPMIIDDEGCIIDFYLDDYDIYVNINCDIFHWMPNEKATLKLKKSIEMRKTKDLIIRDLFKKNNLTLIELYSFEEMEQFILDIIKGGDAYGKF